jgi:hypothetical protein
MLMEDGKGGSRVVAARAVEFNGSDLNGETVIDVHSGGVRVAAFGGVNNTISTAEGYRTARYGIGAAAIVAGTGIIAGQAANAYGANQAASSASNVAASRSAAAQAASKGATTVRLAEIKAASEAAAAAAKAAPAGGSTIQAVVPAVVTPVGP